MRPMVLSSMIAGLVLLPAGCADFPESILSADLSITVDQPTTVDGSVVGDQATNVDAAAVVDQAATGDVAAPADSGPAADLFTAADSTVPADSRPAGKAGQGESCAPAACDNGLACIGPGDERAFCRASCQNHTDCIGYKMYCATTGRGAGKFCVPASENKGLDKDDDCSAPTALCKPNFLCDPAGHTCLESCNTDGAGDKCKGAKTCQNLLDQASGILLGQVCK